MFWALSIVLVDAAPDPNARRPGITLPPQNMSLYGHIVGSFLNVDALTSPLSLSKYIIYLWRRI